MSVVEFEIAMLVVVPALPALTALILITRGGLREHSPSLRERTVLAIRDWLIASDVALLALNNLLGWGWPTVLALLMLLSGLLLISLPSAYWLWLYYRGSFRGPSAP